MNEELELFCEDVEEQLTFMENALVCMQEDGVDDEHIGALFRAMHTIKGTAGMFSFDDVVGFAHIAENLLSDVRDGKIELTEEMIEIFLRSKDHTQILVDLAVRNESLDEETRLKNNELLELLKSMLPNQRAEKVEDKEVVEDGVSGEQLWHLSIRLKDGFFSSGMDIISILGFFKSLGEVEKLLFIDAKIPNITDIEPTKAYVGYEVLFKTESPYDEIEEIFEFVLDDIDLKIFKAHDMDELKSLTDLYSGLREELVFAGFESATRLRAEEEKVEVETKKEPQKEPLEPKKTKSKEKHKSFSLRVDSSKIDQLINQISEMVIANAKVSQRADILDDNELSESATILSDMLEEIRTGVMNIRMVQVGDSFNIFSKPAQTKSLAKPLCSVVKDFNSSIS